MKGKIQSRFAQFTDKRGVLELLFLGQIHCQKMAKMMLELSTKN